MGGVDSLEATAFTIALSIAPSIELSAALSAAFIGRIYRPHLSAAFSAVFFRDLGGAFFAQGKLYTKENGRG